jgi:hypothetical protein
MALQQTVLAVVRLWCLRRVHAPVGRFRTRRRGKACLLPEPEPAPDSEAVARALRDSDRMAARLEAERTTKEGR